MEKENSLSHSLDSATKHYSSMFYLPSYKKALLAVAATCIVAISLSATAFLSYVNSFLLGLSFFAITVATDALVSRESLKNPIFSMRRSTGLSLVCWIIWLVFFFALGDGLGVTLGWYLWVKLVLLGFGAVLTLRFLAFNATSTAPLWRQLLSVLLEPILSVAVLVYFWTARSPAIFLQAAPSIILSPIIAFAAVYLLLFSINRLGEKTYNLSALPLFKAFLLNWVTDQNAPLEKHLEDMGSDADIEVTLLKFDAAKPKAAIIVPQVHPGPFKNIGSSLLPLLLKQEYEKEFGANLAHLWVFWHEMDLASQPQNHKIVQQVIANARYNATASSASSRVKAVDGYATANCQIFGDTAFLSFCSRPKPPKTYPKN